MPYKGIRIPGIFSAMVLRYFNSDKFRISKISEIGAFEKILADQLISISIPTTLTSW